MDLKERDSLGEQADIYWYYVSKAAMVARKLPAGGRRVLDVGAGLGWFSRWMLENGVATEATCVDPGYETEETEAVDGKPISYVKSVERFDADTVLLMDVLEHVDDNIALLKEYWDKASSGTTFIITVPAFNFVWCAHDVHLEHRRRYTTKSLANTIKAAGAQPNQLHYFFASIFPLAVAVRFLRRNADTSHSDLQPVHPLVNRVLTAICGIEAKAATWNKMAGLSVVARMTKP